MVGGGEHQAEEGPLGLCVSEGLMGAARPILIRHAPGAAVLRLRIGRRTGDELIETIAEHEAAHIVEIRFAAVDEEVAIARRLERLGQGEEAAACAAALDHTLGRRGRKAGEHRLDAAHRARSGGIHAGKEHALRSQRAQLGRERLPTEAGHETRAQAFFEQDHHVARPGQGLAWLDAMQGRQGDICRRRWCR